MASPTSVHWSVVLRILHYLQATTNRALLLPSKSSLVLEGYFDFNWAGDVNDKKSTTKFSIFLWSSLISWKSKKQDTVSKSLAEIEYRALADITAEIILLRSLLYDFRIRNSAATPFYSDSKSSMKLAFIDVFHECTKLIEINCHFFHQKPSYTSFPTVVSKLSMLSFSHSKLGGVSRHESTKWVRLIGQSNG